MQLDAFTTGLAGFLSVFSPCILPILPFFLTLMVGLRQQTLRGFALSAALFGLGFALTVFWLVTQSGVGVLLVQHIDLARCSAAGLIALTALLLLTGHSIRLMAFPAGLASGFGWVPCVGPVLSKLLNLSRETPPLQASALFASYASGSILALIGSAVAIWPVARKLAGYRETNQVAAPMLFLFAGLLATDRLSVISAWLLDHFDWSGVLI